MHSHSPRPSAPLFIVCALALSLAGPLSAAFTNLFTIGKTGNGMDEAFGEPTYNTSNPPGSASVRDNDYYTATEPLGNFGRGINQGGPVTRLHFPLAAGQAVNTGRFRVSFATEWASWNGEGYGNHTFVLKINGQTIGTKAINYYGTITLTADAPGLNLVAGDNVLEIRLSPVLSGEWIGFDYVSLDYDATALVDGDGDSIPQYWEIDNGLKDNDGTDALKDPDKDGLTNLQEFTKKTNPHLADTDADGLKDGVETTSNPTLADTDGDALPDGAELALVPPSSPTVIDSDSDTFPDAWEAVTGYNAGSAASKPPGTAYAIGINFVCEAGPLTQLSGYDVAGFAPQMNWNSTRLLYPWDTYTGTKLDIEKPVEDTLVSNAGSTLTSTTLGFTSPWRWTSGNGGSANGKLLDGMLRASGSTPATVTVSTIPFTNYDVLVYVGADYEGGHGFVRLNSTSSTDTHFYTASIRPTSTFIEPIGSTSARPWRGNVIRFRNQTSANCTVGVYGANDESPGIHAVQIVANNVDTDADGMPNWWEFTHKLRADVSDASLDADNDGLTNLLEYQRSTNPRIQDTDGDGLRDGVETNTGTWVSTTSTGSNPLKADTDGDGLSDGVEVANLPNALNPNLADSDSDGRSDPQELEQGTDPVVATSNTLSMPVVVTSPRSFTWTVDDVQMVWDHNRGHTSNGMWGEDFLFTVALRTPAEPDSDAIRMGVRMINGRVSHFLFTAYRTTFSEPGWPTSDHWHADWGGEMPDRRAAFGFSGVGSNDISDRLTFRLTGTCTATTGTPQNKWQCRFEIINKDTGVTVVNNVLGNTNIRAATAIHNNTGTIWQNENGQVNRLVIETHPGIKLYFNPTSLESYSSFAAWKDTDEDGMPDAWEDANTFNKNLATDGPLDTDNDGATNVKEYLAGTNPRNADSDGDNVKDGAEISYGSNPLLASSKPDFALGVPAGVVGEDFNNNSLSDAWESLVGSFGLASTGDPDGDGFTNLQESIAGTDPLNSESRLWSTTLRTGTDLTLRWPRLPHKTHEVWQSADLGAWTLVTGAPAVSGEEYRRTFTGALAGSPKFYKASVKNVDTDGDGVSDWTENMVLGSNASQANSTLSARPVDSNGDGTPDSTISGDYATLLQLFQGSVSGGGFPAGPGGGSSSGSSGTGISSAQAARFLTQATFGPTMKDIDEVRTLGYASWIDAQKTKPVTLQSTYVKSVYDDYFGPKTDNSYNGSEDGNFLFGNNQMTAFARGAIQGQDQLRQRVAFALSQIMVASRRDANLENALMGMADFYDIFLQGAFGNYKDILQKVALHPCMGRYLSHVGNQKADPSINRYPDENFAREVMQLFTIGLWELNMDGSRKVDGAGHHIPTYSNTEITHMARVFTGLWFGGQSWGNGGWSDGDYSTPMSMHADRHDFGQKTLLNGFVLPSRAPTNEDGMRDVTDAIQHLVNHPNTSPFISKQLIQFLVTDNPSAAYINRVATIFADNGSGVRGDLSAVVQAILLDKEAREPSYSMHAPEFGRLKEPVIRTMALARAFGMQQVPDFMWWDWGDFYSSSRQEPSYSPSVFNFYRPEYRAAGLLTQQNLAGPVFQITDSYSSIAMPNKIWDIIQDGFRMWEKYHFTLDLSAEVGLASTPELLVDRLNLLFCGGQMTAASRTIVLNAINQIDASQPGSRARVAVYLMLVAPEGAIMR